MAGIWDILIPAAGTNLITNPSFETNTTGWTTFGGVLTRAAGGNYGIWHAQIVCDTEAPGLFYDACALTSGSLYFASAYVQTSNPVTVTMTMDDTSGNLVGSAATLTGSTDWQRLATSEYSATATANYRLYISVSDTTTTLLVDGAMMEASTSGVVSTYLDGDQPGCYWNGTKHGSTSTRKATEREGGIWTDLIDLGVRVTGSFGLGIGDHELTMSEFSLRDGGEVRNSRTPSSNFTLTVTITGSTLADLHSKREAFINYLKPNRYGKKNKSPVYLRYRGKSNNVIIKAYQEGGLSFSRSGGEGFTEQTGIRFVREDETVAREYNGSVALDYNDVITASATESNIILRNNGAWSVPTSGVNGIVYATEYDETGNLYLGGTFTQAGGGPTTVNRIAKYNGDTYSPLGAAGVNSTVYCIKSIPNGTVYFGGAFTASGDGSPIDLLRVAKYNGDTISQVGKGFDADVRCFALDGSGSLYAGGSFTADSAGNELRRVAKLVADTWTSVGAGFSDGIVKAIAFDLSGNMYAGGTFTADSDGGAFPNSFAKLAAGSDTWAPIAGTINDTTYDEPIIINKIELTPDGTIYFGGKFYTGTYNSIGKYNGLNVSDLGDTTSIKSIITGLKYNPNDNLLYIGAGDLYSFSPKARSGSFVFNGKNIIITDQFSEQSITYDFAFRENIIALGGDIDEETYAAHINTVTVIGSGDAYPTLSLVGTTDLVFYWLESQTTGERIYMNMTVMDGETITVNFKDNSVTSSFGRNLYSSILSGSDFGGFHLVSGDNLISAFGTGTGTAVLSWTERDTGL